MSDSEPRPAAAEQPTPPVLMSPSKTKDDTSQIPSFADDSLNRSSESGNADLTKSETAASADGITIVASTLTAQGDQEPCEEAKVETHAAMPRRPHAAMPRRRRWRFSLREYMGLVTIVILATGLVFSIRRLRHLEVEVANMRSETGYLQETAPGQIAAARAPSDQPLTYRVRVRVPEGASKFRVAYSSLWPSRAAGPQWYGAVPMPGGESIVTIRVLEDPRDKKWKIASLVSSVEGNQRMATVLPPKHVTVFRGSHDVLSTGVGRETQAVQQTGSIRLLDERWLVGEGALLLYGDRAPTTDQIGIYAELQPDVGPL
jgi:hypothetical protein